MTIWSVLRSIIADRVFTVFIVFLSAVFMSATIVEVMPLKRFVARWLGDPAGMTGIMIGTPASWCLPVPPIVFYPITAVLLKTGAGMPQLSAVIVAWWVFGIHRTVPMEFPLMGLYLVTLRLMSSMEFPPIAGNARAFPLRIVLDAHKKNTPPGGVFSVRHITLFFLLLFLFVEAEHLRQLSKSLWRLFEYLFDGTQDLFRRLRTHG